MVKQRPLTQGDIVQHKSREHPLRILIIEGERARCANAFRKPEQPDWFLVKDLRRVDHRPMKVWTS